MIEINPEVVAYTLTILFLITSTVAGTAWNIAKRKLRNIRLLLDDVDDAVYDDEVSEDEFRVIFNRLKTLIKR